MYTCMYIYVHKYIHTWIYMYRAHDGGGAICRGVHVSIYIDICMHRYTSCTRWRCSIYMNICIHRYMCTHIYIFINISIVYTMAVVREVRYKDHIHTVSQNKETNMHTCATTVVCIHVQLQRPHVRHLYIHKHTCTNTYTPCHWAPLPLCTRYACMYASMYINLNMYEPVMYHVYRLDTCISCSRWRWCPKSCTKTAGNTALDESIFFCKSIYIDRYVHTYISCTRWRWCCTRRLFSHL